MSMTKSKDAYQSAGLDVSSMLELERAIRAVPEPYSNSGRSAMEAFVQWTLMALVECNSAISEITGLTATINPNGLGFRAFKQEESDRIVDSGGACLDAYGDAIKVHGPFTDLLGPLYAVLVGGGGQNACQHFTPWNMAMGIVSTCPKSQSSTYTIADPACGAGTLLLAQLQARHNTEGKQGCGTAIVMAGDKDPLCAAMTALQLMASQFAFSCPIGEVSISVEDAIRRDGFVAFHSIRKGRGIVDALGEMSAGRIDGQVGHGGIHLDADSPKETAWVK